MSTIAIDLEKLRDEYARTSTDELLEMVSFESREFEPEALGLMRAELMRRTGESREELSRRTRDMKAERYDKITSQQRQVRQAPLANWMIWILLLEGWTLSLYLIIYLAFKGRTGALREAIVAAGIGWAIKGVLFANYVLTVNPF